MKKVILLLPDKINRTIGASRWSKTDEIALTPENLLLVRSGKSNYHDREVAIHLLSIEFLL
jgi:hypothetical protein